MIRRRRPQREIAFSFDSFLDVVANVVGIILRLILVAWVGAQSYVPAVQDEPDSPAPAPLAELAPLPAPTDPLAKQNQRQRIDLDKARAMLNREVGRVEPLRRQRFYVADKVANLTARRQGLADAKKAAEREAQQREAAGRAVVLSLEELTGRSRQLLRELDELRKAPSLKKSLRYRMPVSQPVTEEVAFECRSGRVTLIDVDALVDKIYQAAGSAREQLRHQWTVRSVTPAVGAFRFRYVLERARGPLEPHSPAPTTTGPFELSLVGWVVEPVVAERGETADAALATGSAFRKIVDTLDVRETAVTLWVYDDSFPLYRRLRDYLHDRGVMVAGRPLPLNVPIASSRDGTGSRGQ
jgi:hypothetical protein